MKEVVKTGALRAVIVGIFGLIVGAVAGWVAFGAAEDSAEIGRIGSDIFPSLFAVVPAVQIGLLALGLRKRGPSDHWRFESALIQVLLTAVVGAAIAAILYVAATVQVPAVLGGYDAKAATTAMTSRIGLARLLALEAVAIAVGVLLAVATHLKARDSTS